MKKKGDTLYNVAISWSNRTSLMYFCGRQCDELLQRFSYEQRVGCSEQRRLIMAAVIYGKIKSNIARILSPLGSSVQRGVKW